MGNTNEDIRELIVIMGFLFLTALCGFIILGFKKRNETELQLAKSNLSFIKSQMNPHFVFNCVYSIYNLILDEKFDETNRYIGKFSSILRAIMHSNELSSIPLNQEIRVIRDYIDLEKLRFNNDFCFQLGIEINEEDQKRIKIPPMLIQPYVENAIKHGLVHKLGLKELSINIKMIAKLLIICIEDNGIGRKAAKQYTTKENCSFATNAIEQRIMVLNSISTARIKVSTKDVMSGMHVLGTKVIVQIPVRTVQFNGCHTCFS